MFRGEGKELDRNEREEGTPERETNWICSRLSQRRRLNREPTEGVERGPGGREGSER